jgi:hypothetical protein
VKTKIVALAVALMLLFFLTIAVQPAKANFIPTCMIQAVSLGGSPANFTGYYTILRDFTFPTPFETRSLQLDISVGFVLTANRTISCNLDGGANVTATGYRYSMDELWKAENVTATLPALENGLHRVDIYVESIPKDYAQPDHRSIHFTVSSIEPAPLPPTPTHPPVATHPPPPTIETPTATLPPTEEPNPTSTVAPTDSPTPTPFQSPTTSPTASASAQQSPSPSPSVPEFAGWVVVTVMLASAVAVFAVVKRKH